MKLLHTPGRANAHEILTKFLLLFLLLLPFFDLLSFLYLKGYISIGFSTVAKPLLMGLLNLALIFLYKKHFWRCAIPYGLYLVMITGHVLLTNALEIDRQFILTNIRTSISMLYLLVCAFNCKILYDEAPEKAVFISKLSKTVLGSFALYCLLYFLAVFSGTSALTYEYADPNKIGWKGWLDSGQVLAHALAICLPYLSYLLLHNRNQKRWVRILCKVAIVIPVALLCMIGTKVAYYIPILVLGAQTMLELFFALKNKEKSQVVNAVICAVCVCACILVYPITPTKHNTSRNEHALTDSTDSPRIQAVIEQEESSVITYGEKDTAWSEHALAVLRGKYDRGELHPAQSRDRQWTYNFEKFMAADWIYKIFGMGHWNQQTMAMERDVMAMFFGYGIFGFLLIITWPILLWLKSAFGILKGLKRVDLPTLCLFEGFSMAFFISWYAGSTFIYPQFTVFLAVIMCLMRHHTLQLNAHGTV